jgi:hypothetical protein
VERVDTQAVIEILPFIVNMVDYTTLPAMDPYSKGSRKDTIPKHQYSSPNAMQPEPKRVSKNRIHHRRTPQIQPLKVMNMS